jgi:hypothetical protein
VTTIKDFFAHPIIQTALVTGVSTVVLAWFSKRVAPEPLRSWELALPVFLFTLWQGFAARKNAAPWFRRPWLGMVVIVVATAIVLVTNR